ncbi:hypothetical protein HGRIS_013702 [Hohenbuehelia grisea]|uniref:Hydrophobin n=1 Tax=Hohenbuehelia grisea TaxID=104357 RepID=A0ABR3IWG1_9AGAR
MKNQVLPRPLNLEFRIFEIRRRLLTSIMQFTMSPRLFVAIAFLTSFTAASPNYAPPSPYSQPPTPSPVPSPAPPYTCTEGRYLCCYSLEDPRSVAIEAVYVLNNAQFPDNLTDQVGFECTAPPSNTAYTQPTPACCSGEDLFNGDITLNCSEYDAP